MIPILDSTAVVATDSESMRSSGGSTSNISADKQFGAILSAQEGASRPTDTAPASTLERLGALAASGNLLPTGGNKLPASVPTLDLTLTSEAVAALPIGPERSETLLATTPATLLETSAVVPEEAPDSPIITELPIAVVAPNIQAIKSSDPLVVAEDVLSGPLNLPADALMRLINPTNTAAHSSGPALAQRSLESPVLDGDLGRSQKPIMAGTDLSVVTAKTDIAVDAVDTLKPVDLLSLKTAPANPPSALQAVAGALPAIADSAGAWTGSLKPGVIPSLNTPVGHPNWTGDFASRIGVMVKNGMPEASLQLSPAELGRLDIKISTDGDQAKVVFTVQNMAAREAIEQAMPRLRDMLEQSGMQLAHSEVADQSQSHPQGGDTDNRFAGQGVTESEEPINEMTSIPVSPASNAMVDYYV